MTVSGDDVDTIVALGTASTVRDAGDGAIGVIRLSGPRAFSIVSRMFRGKRAFESIKPYTIGYGLIYDADRAVDEVLVLKMGAPRSYTREDVAEIHCHAGAEVQRRIIKLAIREGARAAGPGEFTKRAFLNGRIDLSQAEAVMDLIKARSEAGASAALSQLEGALSAKLGAARGALIGLIASLEAHLDFPELEADEPGGAGIGETLSGADAGKSPSNTGIANALSGIGIVNSLRRIERELCALADSFEYGRAAREGVTAVIAGRPNVGKSTLLNLFAGRDRAIVTDIPGTTRDMIDDYKDIGGFTVRFLDTAGIRDTEDSVERIGVARTIAALEKADLALLIVGADEGYTPGDERIAALAEGKKRIFIINKTDLVTEARAAEIRDAIAGRAGGNGAGELFDANEQFVTNGAIVGASLINGIGLDAIENSIIRLFAGQSPPGYGDAVLTNARHFALVSRGAESIRAAIAALGAGMPFEIPIIDMRDALSALGEITGETFAEDIIDRIFSEFCVGK